MAQMTSGHCMELIRAPLINPVSMIISIPEVKNLFGILTKLPSHECCIEQRIRRVLLLNSYAFFKTTSENLPYVVNPSEMTRLFCPSESGRKMSKQKKVQGPRQGSFLRTRSLSNYIQISSDLLQM